LKHFHMDNLDSKPVHPAIIESIKNCINSKKRKVYDEILDEVIADIFIPINLKASFKVTYFGLILFVKVKLHEYKCPKKSSVNGKVAA